MGAGSTAKRRRTGTDSSVNSATPSRTKPTPTGRGRGRPPNAPRDGRERPPPLAECFRKRCNDVLDRLSKKDHYNIFLEPVNTDVVAGYADIIKRPMDFTTMRNKLNAQAYKSLGEFRKDLDLIWSNCLLFNGKEPTNIFSKKAIELRRLTEKLIVTTRQYLEKDKENLLKWKEKHRRRKETMQANAANAQAALHGHTIGNPSLLSSRDRRTHMSSAVRDPLEATTADFNNEDFNGRTPQQTALAESLRLQYAGTTGLYKKSMVNAPFPQYTKPDGSVVQIPVRRYRPEEDQWRDDSSSHRRHVIRNENPPTLLCDSLPSESPSNRCAPRPNMNHVLVKNYAESLHSFFKGTEMEHVGSQIVAELLRPELEVKKRQDDLVKKGFNLKDLENKARVAAARNPAPNVNVGPPKHHWDAEAIIKLADDIEKANRRQVSLLPKLLRPINELDGIGGLERLLGKEIAKEVDEVPVDVIDFSMPHGVSLESLTEICRLKHAPTIKISPHDLQCVEALRKTAQDHVQNLGQEAASKRVGAAAMTSAQLHEKQMRAKLVKQNWRAEAARQAKLIEERRRSACAKPDDLATMRHRGVELPVQNAHRMSLESRQGAKTSPGVAVSKRAVDVATAELEKGINMALKQAPAAGSHAACTNCGAREVLAWQAGGTGAGAVERLCIPCGLHWQQTGTQRPKDQAAELLQRRDKHVVGNPASNGLVSGVVQQKQSAVAQINANGVANRPIQKTLKSAQMPSRRSSPSGGARGKIPKPRMPVGIPPFNHVNPQSIQPTGNSVSNSFIMSNPQAGVAHEQNMAHLFSNSRTSMEARNALVAQSMQQLQNLKREGTESLTTGVSNGLRVAALQHQLRADMGQMMYRGQQPGAAVMQSQQLLGMESQGQANIVNRPSHAYLPTKATKLMGQQPTSSNVPAQNPMVSFAPHLLQAKNPPMLMNMHDGLTHQVAPGLQPAASLQATIANQLHQRIQRSAAQHVQAQVQPGVQSGVRPGVQAGLHSGLQPGLQPGVQPGVPHTLQPRMQTRVQPGLHPGVQPGVQSAVQPVVHAQAPLQTQAQTGQAQIQGRPSVASQARAGVPPTHVHAKLGQSAVEAQLRQVAGQSQGLAPPVQATTQEQVSNGQVNMGGERGGGQSGLAEEMVIGDMPSFMNNGGGSSGVLSNFGEGSGQNAFGGNGSGTAELGLGSDQMVDMEDMIFAEGAIEAPTGSPDFGF